MPEDFAGPPSEMMVSDVTVCFPGQEVAFLSAVFVLCFFCFNQHERLFSSLLGALNHMSASNLYVFSPSGRNNSFVSPMPSLLKCQGNNLKTCLESQPNKIISIDEFVPCILVGAVAAIAASI